MFQVLKEVATRRDRYFYAFLRFLCRLRYWLFRHWRRSDMASAALSEVRLKIDRANKNIDDLKRFLPGRELAKVDGDLAAIKTQPDGKTYDIHIRVVDPLPQLRMAIADVIHDLRTALDYLAYRLALGNGFPAVVRTLDERRKLRKLSFLIHDDPQRFSSSAGNVRPLIGSLAVAEMEKLQPYKGTDKRGPVLWTLSELDNITKHRMITAIQQELDHANVRIDFAGQSHSGVVTHPAGAGPLKDGAKLISFQIDAPQQPPKVDVNVESVFKIVFSETDGLCDGQNIFVVMRDSVAAVSSIVDDFERLFF